MVKHPHRAARKAPLRSPPAPWLTIRMLTPEPLAVSLGGETAGLQLAAEVTYCLAEGVKRGTIDGGVAKLILARVLPSVQAGAA